MLNDLLGNMEESQKAMKEKLSGITIDGEAGGGAIKVTVNANRELLDINFDTSKLDWEDKEMVADLLITAINRTMKAAADREQIEAQGMMKDMLPPGLGGLLG